jgi:plastocyanin
MTRERSIIFPRRLIVTAVLVAASAGLLTSCSSSGSKTPSGTSSSASSSSSSTAASTATGASDTIQVKDFSFEPGTLTVAPGTKVTWDFDDVTAHNVTADNKAFASPTVNKGHTFSYTFNSPGTYNYICTIHQYMKGAITVK